MGGPPRTLLHVTPTLLFFAWVSSFSLTYAHEHHQTGPADNRVPVDSILWIHIALQAFTWVILFPLVMILGLVRHRLHVPLASLSLLLTTGGYFLGHSHGGRSFPHTAHGTMASLMVLYLAAQTALGVYLKLHLKIGEKWVRPWIVLAHGILGKSFPIVGWVQALFGISTLQSWCFGGHLGQCLAHYIMGSAFQAYALILLIMMKAGGSWLERRGCSQEWFDSWVIMIWGVVNTFTEHHGGPWTHKDLQHTLMGVLWWAGGAVGIWLSRGGRRNVFPAIIIILTGWAMSAHEQSLMISTKVHSLFGYSLMAAGLARVIEVCFVLKDQPTGTTSDGRPSRESPTEAPESRGEAWYPIKAFQYLPPYLLTASGVLFMSATDEELKWANDRGVDHATWGLIDFSVSLAMFFWFNVLVDSYISFGGRYGASKFRSRQIAGVAGLSGPEARLEYSRLSMNGHSHAPGSEHHEMGRLRPGAKNISGATHQQVEEDEGMEARNHILFDEVDDDPFEDDDDDLDQRENGKKSRR
ncbi:hypothetical protein IE53DRAFT_339417 [Violaceomyces palustris]|uniref:Uncharacterized protein n=1 Tax=Violaceomyces palustris TaxID=1673888 RepID=A0ACD0P4X1_9BASI|nr:hypothetical protein IE53DRAFT_339417 [Violaceomyces palustris]